MSLVYVEYKSRLRGVGLDLFHKVQGRAGTGWAGEHPEDVPILNVGRTWRIGPAAEYLIVYYTPNGGLERLDEWERVFATGEADHLEVPRLLASSVDAAGCYYPLSEPVPAAGGPYYGEFFDLAPARTREDVAQFFEQRRRDHPRLQLHLLADRIGKLGPDPRGMAFWGLDDFGALAAVAEELDEVDDPIRLVSAGLYADVGKEIL
jgi:hypothetical protein